MASIETKLNKFSSFVLEDALSQRDEMMEKLEKERKQRIGDLETELLTEAYSDIQAAAASARRESNERVLKTELELKKELILKREKIIDEVFAKVRARVDEYIKSPEYEKWLLKKLEGALCELGEGKKKVCLSAADMAYASAIEKRFDGVAVSQTDEGIIGGFTAFNEDRRVFADCSIASALNEARENFLQMSGLSIG